VAATLGPTLGQRIVAPGLEIAVQRRQRAGDQRSVERIGLGQLALGAAEGMDPAGIEQVGSKTLLFQQDGKAALVAARGFEADPQAATPGHAPQLADQFATALGAVRKAPAQPLRMSVNHQFVLATSMPTNASSCAMIRSPRLVVRGPDGPKQLFGVWEDGCGPCSRTVSNDPARGWPPIRRRVGAAARPGNPDHRPVRTDKRERLSPSNLSPCSS
jgi:hypothetical protein